MIFANVNGEKTHIKNANKGDIGKDCWFTNYDVMACKGHYRQYWKYMNDRPELPEGYENETEWHNAWKSCLKDEYIEVICGDNREHRADIFTGKNVIEIQYSSISYEKANERIRFYNNLTNNRVIWVFNEYKSYITKHLITKPINKNLFLLKWKYGKSVVKDISNLLSTDIYLDISNKSEHMMKVWRHNNDMYMCWKTKLDFYNEYLKDYSNIDYDEFLKGFINLDIKDYL